MTRRLDDAVAARERVLPGLAMLLDGEAFAEALDAALPGAGIEGARAVYVRYKPATSCLVAYRVRARGGEHDIYARAHTPGAAEKLDKAERRSRRSSALGPGGLVLDGEAVAVHAFPHDRRLRELPGLVRRGSRARILRNALPSRPELWEAKAKTLRYKAERRWVARLRGADGTRAVLKLHTAERFRQAVAAATALAGEPGLPRPDAGDSGVPVVRVLGIAPRARAIVLDWCRGTPLDVLLADSPDEALALAPEAGAALAALHRTHAPGLTIRDRYELLRRLEAAAEATSSVRPELLGRTAALTRSLAAPAGAAGAVVPTHGDCSIDQIVANHGEVRLLDLDRAAQDEPAADLGSLVADLEARTFRGELAPGHAAAMSAALLEGYRAAGGPAAIEGPELARQTAASVLRRSPEPFRTRDPDWGARTEALLERAEDLASAATLGVQVGVR